MKPIIYSLLACFFSTIIFAQNPKKVVAIMPFAAASASSEYGSRASQLQEIIVEIVSKKSDIILIDRSKDTLLMRELDNQLRTSSLNAATLAQQGKILGAQNIIIGTLTNVSVEPQTSTTKNLVGNGYTTTTTYNANVAFSLQLVDVETGSIINQKSFNSNKGDKFFSFSITTGHTKEEALGNAMTARKKEVIAWINECYAPDIKILKIEERDKKGNPATILLSGVDASLAAGTKLSLNEIEMIDIGDGKQLRRSKNIATLKIADKQDEITVCKITDGGKEIDDKMKANAKLEVVVK